MSFGAPHHYMDEREARELHAAYGQPGDPMMDNGPPVHMPPMGTNSGHFSDSYERGAAVGAGGAGGGYHLGEPANKKQRVYEPLSDMLYTNDTSYPSSLPMSSSAAAAYGMPNQYGGFSSQTYPPMGNSPAASMSTGQPTETELRLALTCQVMVKQIRDLHAALSDMRQRSLFLASQVDQLRGELSYFHNVVSNQPTPSSSSIPPPPIASTGPGLTPTGRMPPSAPMPSSLKNESKEAPRKRGRPRLANAFCSMCGATQTPQWRKHNDQRMCNACGLLHRDRGHKPPGSGGNSPPPPGLSGPPPLLPTTATLPGGIANMGGPGEFVGKGKKDKTHHSLSYPPLDRDKINAALTLQYSKPPFVQSGSMTPSPASNKSDSTSGSSVSSLPNRLGSIPFSVPSSTVSSAAPSPSAMRPLNGSFPMSDRSAFSRSNTRSVSSVDSDVLDKMSVLSGSSTPSPASSIHSASTSQFMSAIASSTAINNGTSSSAPHSLPSTGSRTGSLSQLSSISSPPSRPTLPPVQLPDLQSASSALPPLAPGADLKGTLPFPFQMYVSNQLSDSAPKQGGPRLEPAGNSTERPVEAVLPLSKAGPPAGSSGSRQVMSESNLSREEEEYDEGDLLLEEGDYVSSEEDGESEDDEQDDEDDMDA
eukprot:GILJ01010506.1.p1 GENE.GILJ01010506.1~~GILJ01010506.1.p1  ORF type:complete len:648 (+),score=101.89 GILJ01010506.1:152-2095(+)